MNVYRYFFCLLVSQFTTSLAGNGQSYDPRRFEKQVIVSACNDPMQLEITPNGRLFFIERNGTLKIVDLRSNQITVAGKVPTDLVFEIGMLGLALDRDFVRTQVLYLFFAPLEKKNFLRLARFKMNENKLDLNSQQILLEYPLEDDKLNHQGGGLFMAHNGDLILGTGDSTPPIPELQIDERPGNARFDAQRTSANSMDLRGKILRIHPVPDGSYTIPKDNLFPDGKGGRPEIYAMGVRNGFRQFADPKTGFIYWGDVGQNITEAIGVGPNGYDEINQARRAGNFGWPYFTGNNETYRDFDFTTRQAGALFDVKNPVNDSPNNTGLRKLPLPQPAFIWYPSTESPTFPMFGSGGRSAMTGPVYYADPAIKNNLKLPEAFHHMLFVYDWMRNRIMTVALDDREHISKIERFLPGWSLRKPIELKLAPDHTLYLIETGDKWSANTDSQISRIVYRRGNRPPEISFITSALQGKAPLTIQFDASGSRDPDGDSLRVEWAFGKNGVLGRSVQKKKNLTFRKAGIYPVLLTVTDKKGSKRSQKLDITVGNALPEVAFDIPANGTFYDPGESVSYRVRVRDDEDGTSETDPSLSERIAVDTWTSTKASSASDVPVAPGLQLMKSTTCFGCHTINEKSIGPSYANVAKRYSKENGALQKLSRKIISGGGGVWGADTHMPSHPQHTLEQAHQMVEWILSLENTKNGTAKTGDTGTLTAPTYKPDNRTIAAVMVLKASYTDRGAAGVPSGKGEAFVILHPRRKKAAAFDKLHGVEIVDVFEGGEGNVARTASGSWLALEQINLTGIRRVSVRAAPLEGAGCRMEMHLDSPDGPKIAEGNFTGTDKNRSPFLHNTLSLSPITGLHTLYITLQSESSNLPIGKAIPFLDINWLEFLP